MEPKKEAIQEYIQETGATLNQALEHFGMSTTDFTQEQLESLQQSAIQHEVHLHVEDLDSEF